MRIARNPCPTRARLYNPGQRLARIPAANFMLRPIALLFCSFVLFMVPFAVCAPTAGAKPQTDANSSMRVYPSRYYIIHTDLSSDDVKEAVIRMNKMAEEYHERTRGFSGEIRERL